MSKTDREWKPYERKPCVGTPSDSVNLSCTHSFIRPVFGDVSRHPLFLLGKEIHRIQEVYPGTFSASGYYLTVLFLFIFKNNCIRNVYMCTLMGRYSLGFTTNLGPKYMVESDFVSFSPNPEDPFPPFNTFLLVLFISFVPNKSFQSLRLNSDVRGNYSQFLGGEGPYPLPPWKVFIFEENIYI